MKKLTTILAVLAMSSVFVVAAEKPADGGKKRDPEAAFKKIDGDSNSKVSLEEFKNSPMGKKDAAKAEEIFKKKDKDSDGSLTLEEFSAGGKKKDK
jgi:Ca2+-binding EF-hand superfamily protein